MSPRAVKKHNTRAVLLVAIPAIATIVVALVGVLPALLNTSRSKSASDETDKTANAPSTTPQGSNPASDPGTAPKGTPIGGGKSVHQTTSGPQSPAISAGGSVTVTYGADAAAQERARVEQYCGALLNVAKAAEAQASSFDRLVSDFQKALEAGNVDVLRVAMRTTQMPHFGAVDQLLNNPQYSDLAATVAGTLTSITRNLTIGIQFAGDEQAPPELRVNAQRVNVRDLRSIARVCRTQADYLQKRIGEKDLSQVLKEEAYKE